MSSKFHYLTERRGRFVYKRDVPEDLRLPLGRTAWWIILDAPDRKRAETLARMHAEQHDALIQRLRAEGPGPLMRQQIAEIEAKGQAAIENYKALFFGGGAIRRRSDDTRLDFARNHVAKKN